MHSRCLAFLPFKFRAGAGEGEGKDFFHFSLVPNVFPNMFTIALLFYFICFDTSFQLHRWAQGEELYTSK